MGNCIISNDVAASCFISTDFFNFFEPVGQGMLGKIWRGANKENSLPCAIKVIEKSLITSEQAIKTVLNEKEILISLHHPFIVNLQFAFHDQENLYLALDLKQAGDLRYHIINESKFTEEQGLFFANCLLLGLEYIHSKNVIHRDIKPENLIFDPAGFLYISDFGASFEIKNKLCEEFSGTPGYVAPESLFRKKHGLESDFFSLGVVLFEVLFGCRPFSGRNFSELKKEIMEIDPFIHVPGMEKVSENCLHFVKGLMQKNPKKRLGKNGIEEVKMHPWIRKSCWEDIAMKNVKPPFRPLLKENFKSFANYQSKYHQKKEKIHKLDDRFIGYFYVSPYLMENTLK